MQWYGSCGLAGMTILTRRRRSEISPGGRVPTIARALRRRRMRKPTNQGASPQSFARSLLDPDSLG
jgi:hypothetical protein